MIVLRVRKGFIALVPAPSPRRHAPRARSARPHAAQRDRAHRVIIAHLEAPQKFRVLWVLIPTRPKLLFAVIANAAATNINQARRNACYAEQARFRTRSAPSILRLVRTVPLVSFQVLKDLQCARIVTQARIKMRPDKFLAKIAGRVSFSKHVANHRATFVLWARFLDWEQGHVDNVLQGKLPLLMDLCVKIVVLVLSHPPLDH